MGLISLIAGGIMDANKAIKQNQGGRHGSDALLETESEFCSGGGGDPYGGADK